MILLDKDHHSFKKQHKSYSSWFFMVFSLLVIRADVNMAWDKDGLCPETLGGALNNHLDDCMNSHHYFRAMRAYGLKHLYKIKCCPGYKEIVRRGREEEMECKAVCSSPCVGGTCVRPETCECKVGYFLRSRYICAPICYPSCRNGQCVGVDHCSCNIGYSKVNGSKSDCEPVCEPQCVNGYCKTPGVCECNDGYMLKPGSNRICEPKCDPSCTNAICTSPNICQCKIGYSKVNDDICKPMCHLGCGVGNCSAPDTCTCPVGYEALSGQTCQPTCRGCVGGICVSPDVCHCPNGRTLNEEFGKCVNVCDPPCLNGDCIDSGVCICRKGYSKSNVSGFCEPVCIPNCINGRCVKPDQCECLEEYRVSPSSNRECEAVCTNPCYNGTCIAPEKCQCLEGYAQLSNNSCTPICFNGCGPGSCTSPNSCSCPMGYEATDGGPCEPVCSESCENGFCVEPDFCVCSKGYSFDETSGNCEPMAKTLDILCSPSCKDCVNGVCTSSDTCTCLPGHNKRLEDPFVCLPELGQFSDKATPFLNFFHFSSAIRYLEDNETFAFVKLPKLSIRKNCDFLFQNTNITSDNSSKLDFVQLDCALLESSSELNIELYCQWPLEGSDLSSFNQTEFSVQNISITEQENLWNFSLNLEFAETFASGEEGYCTMCIQPSIGSQYFSLSGLDDLLLAPCNEDILVGITSTLEGELPVMWIAVGCAFGISVILLTSAVIVFIVKSSSWNQYQKTETVEAEGISTIEITRKCKENHYQEAQGILFLKENYILEDCGSSNNITEC